MGGRILHQTKINTESIDFKVEIPTCSFIIFFQACFKGRFVDQPSINKFSLQRISRSQQIMVNMHAVSTESSSNLEGPVVIDHD
jgi:hypothetical protein